MTLIRLFRRIEKEDWVVVSSYYRKEIGNMIEELPTVHWNGVEYFNYLNNKSAYKNLMLYSIKELTKDFEWLSVCRTDC